MVKERYKNLDGIRAYAAIGIILMHVLANGKFKLNGFLFEKLIPSFTNLVFLFMILSSFSMCCGYYDKFQRNEISLEDFYRRRYQRIWPVFAILCTIEMLIDHSLNSVFEWFVDLTLMFGFIPSNGIKVVGVGWFLGTIFAFYMLFPFFVFLLKDKKRGWFIMMVCLTLHVLCNIRFFDAAQKSNIVYSSIYFVAGGLIFLYRELLSELSKYSWIVFLMIIGVTAFYFIFSNSEYTIIVLFSLLTILGMQAKGNKSKIIFQNKIVGFLGTVSMEIYLCHMFIYRVIEKLKLVYPTGNETFNYFLVSVITLSGSAVMALILKECISFARKKIGQRS